MTIQNFQDKECTDANETNTVLQLPRETGTIKLSCDLSVSAIIELGQLYKKLYEGEWIYGNIEKFVEENFISFMEFWDWNSDVDTDLGVELWWDKIGRFRKINRRKFDCIHWSEILRCYVTPTDVVALNERLHGYYDYKNKIDKDNYKVYKSVDEYVENHYDAYVRECLIHDLGHAYRRDKNMAIKDFLFDEFSVPLESGQVVVFKEIDMLNIDKGDLY